jgi:hypothetical protein
MVIKFAHQVTRLREQAAYTKGQHETNLYYHAKRILDFQNGQAREDDHYEAAGQCPCCHQSILPDDLVDAHEVSR